MNVYDLLKTEAGLSRAEVDKYFVVTEKDKETVLKLRGKAWLEAKTYAAMQELVKKTGGSYTPTPPTFTVPLGAVGSNPTPAKPTHEEPKTKPAKPVEEIDYTTQGYCCPICNCVVNKNVYESMKRKFAQYPELFSFSEETA